MNLNSQTPYQFNQLVEWRARYGEAIGGIYTL